MRVRLLLSALVLLLLTSACAVQPPGQDNPGPPAGGTPPPPPLEPQCNEHPMFEVTFCSDMTAFPNPERGFHEEFELANDTSLRVQNPDVTLVRSYVRLDDWRHDSLPAWLLADLERGFAAVRTAGKKVIPRFTYNFGPDPDAPLTSVLLHIEQLTPVLERNSDVIAVLQAGFIGRWGEWHSSEHGLTSPGSKQQIGRALLAALPDDRSVQIRTPFHIRHVLGNDDLFDPAEAFSAAGQARIGFVNDCFLSGPDDVGTYATDFDRVYAQAMTPFTPTGGETCDHPAEPASRQQCPNALAELNAYHWDYLNSGYYAGVLNQWRSGGCFAEINLRLGYRFELLGASVSGSPAAGFVLDLGIRNVGFGKLYNPRPLEIVAVSGDQRITVFRHEDARHVMPLSGETITHLPLSLDVPPPGTWQLELYLPDAADSLRGNPAYSIRLASLDAQGNSIWNPVSGSNRLGLSLQLPLY